MSANRHGPPPVVELLVVDPVVEVVVPELSEPSVVPRIVGSRMN
jgi:hypothetical protein